MYFQHPEFLFGLFALLIPLVIHLFNFRRHKKVYFSQVKLLKQITIETRKQRNLLHIIVLLLRMLVLLFLVLAIAKPVFESPETQEVTSSGEKTIYIDNSFSMMSEGSQGRLFNNAIGDALVLVNGSPQDARFIVKDNDQYGLFNKALSRDEAADKLGEIQITPIVRSLSEVLLSGTKPEATNTDSRQMLIFSDFQKNTADLQNIPADSNINYLFFPLQTIRYNNLVVDSLWFAEPMLIPGRKSTCLIRLKNNASTDYEKIPVVFIINGQQKAVAGVDLKAHTSTNISISYTPESAGWKYGEVKIEDYPITFDDQLFFAVKVVPHINILAISNNGSSPALRQLFGSDSLFLLHQESAQHINYNRFNQYNLIILNSLNEITSGLSTQLVQYMEQGGHVVVISGSNLSEAGLLQQTQSGRIAVIDTSKTRVSGIKITSPLFKNSIGRIPKNADLPIVLQHSRYIFTVQSGVESLVSLLNGDDLLARKNIGKGQLYMLSSGLDRSYGNLSSNLLFVPIMAGIASLSGSPEPLFYTVGQDEQLNFKLSTRLQEDKPITIVKKDAEESFIPEQLIQQGQLQLSLFGNINTSGYYHLMLNDSLVAAMSFNYSRNESDLRSYHPDEIDSICKASGIPHYRIVDLADTSYTEVINALQKDSPIWKLFIIFALLALLAEGLLLRFGK
ncbi:MAG: BatA domain-containing protein [Bacteroidales bacterium]|nr:BatA domain-containing protein [Bacteroidales bacterium]